MVVVILLGNLVVLIFVKYLPNSVLAWQWLLMRSTVKDDIPF